MSANVGGFWNTVVGNDAHNACSGCQYNTVLGKNALRTGTGSWNVTIGADAMAQASGGAADRNVAIGYVALIALTTGDNNTAIGYQAGDSITTGAGNILLGYDVDTSAAGASNQLNIGGTVFGDLSTDNVRIGGSGAVSAFSNLEVTGTLAMTLPGGTDAQRPGTPAGGMFRYNTTATPKDVIEYYDSESAAWVQVPTSVAGGAVLSGITAATADNTITSAAWNQTWNWALTAATEDAFTFGESAASTGGSGDQSVLKAAAMAASTAIPLLVNNAGAGVSFKVADDGTDTDATPFVIDASGSVGIGTASPASALDVNGGVKVANDAAACIAGKAGTIRYTGGTPPWEFRNGSAWIPFEQAGSAGCAGPADCPAIGNICTDGTVFAGCAPPLHDTPFFVTRCDAGLTTTTTACDTGARTTVSWNNGNASGYVTTSVTGVTDGAANTATLLNRTATAALEGFSPIRPPIIARR